ncbi:MAG: L,D-transpeptidase family protein, partial [Pseudomonadota bacterium]
MLLRRVQYITLFFFICVIGISLQGFSYHQAFSQQNSTDKPLIYAKNTQPKVIQLPQISRDLAPDDYLMQKMRQQRQAEQQNFLIYKEKQRKLRPIAKTAKNILISLILEDHTETYPDALRKLALRFEALPDSVQKEIYSFYKKRNFRLMWLDKNRPSSQSVTLSEAINNELYLTTAAKKIYQTPLLSDNEADLARFELSFTLNLLQKISFIRNGITNIIGAYGVSDNSYFKYFSSAEALERFTSLPYDQAMSVYRPPFKEYSAMVKAMEVLSQRKDDTEFTRVTRYGKVLAFGYDGVALQPLIQNLKQHNVLKDSVNATFYNEEIAEAVKRFQRQNHLKADGKVGPRTAFYLNQNKQQKMRKLLVNFERLRKMPPLYGERYIRVNIPEFKLTYFENKTPSLTMNVIVGQKKRKTPVFSDEISYIAFNPYWHVPHKIAREDILPRVKNNPSYLARNNYEVLSGNKIIAPHSIDWQDMSKYHMPYRFRQKPGKFNSLGSV